MSSPDHTPQSDSSRISPGDRLDSWKEVASYLNRSVRTVARWERHEGLPVHRHIHSKTGTIYAYKSELDAWWAARGRQLENPATNSERRTNNGSGFRKFLFPGLVVGAISIAAVFWFATRPTSLDQLPRLIPLTTYPGIEGPPSLSPDGNQVAFERYGDIFIKQVDGEALIQLTSTPAIEEAPAWSPDGAQIAFVGDTGIFVISPLGGGERKVADARVPPALKSLAWTPDGKSLIVSELTSPICASLFLVSVTTGEKRRLTWPPEPSIGDGWPVVSPDGLKLAFARYPQDTSANIYVMPVGGGEPRRLTDERASLFGLAWTPDGRRLVFSTDSGGISRLWQVVLGKDSTSSPERVAGSGENARYPSFSRTRGAAQTRLAYQRYDQNVDIRRAELITGRTSGSDVAPSMPFLASTRSDDHPQFSPDGKHIAFVSDRSGTSEVWVCNADGSNPVRLSSIAGPIVAAPRWSPDNQQIAFFAATGAFGNYLIYLINNNGGSPSRLSSNDHELEALPSWSRDGQWIYFTSSRSGSLQIWKRPAKGGDAIQLTRNGGAEALESPDGQRLYYTKVPELGRGLWSVPTTGGEESRVLDTVRFGYWAVLPSGIYYIDFDVAEGDRRLVKFFSFVSHQVTEVGKLEKTVNWTTSPGFSISPDNRWLLYSNLESTAADLMLVDNFR